MGKTYTLEEVKNFMILARDHGERQGDILYEDFVNNLFYPISNPPTVVTPDDLLGRLECEGIAYAIQHYYGKNIKCPQDEKFEKLWKETYDALEKLTDYIKVKYDF